MRTDHIFNSVPQNNQSSPPSLCRTHARTHAHTHTHTRTRARTEAQNQHTVCLNTEIGSEANCEISSTIFQAMLDHKHANKHIVNISAHAHASTLSLAHSLSLSLSLSLFSFTHTRTHTNTANRDNRRH